MAESVTITEVAHGGFTAPLDAVASPSGDRFYFTATTPAGAPAVFQVSSTPGSQAAVLASGGPLVAPSGLVLSCDGETLYVAGGGDDPLLAIPAAGGALQAVAVTEVGKIVGLAMGPDCETLFATGETTDKQPALFTIARAGGAAEVVYAGTPLIAPGPVFVDALTVSWVMDRASNTTLDASTLYAVPKDGSAPSAVVTNVRTKGTPGGVSLNSTGRAAYISGTGTGGGGELTTVELATGNKTSVVAPDLVSPGGLRTARSAPIFALVDRGGDAIYRVDY